MDHMGHMMDMTTSSMHDHMNSTMDMGNDDHSAHSSSMMHMSFYLGVKDVPILFKEWTVNSTGGMVGACIAVCVVAMLYEGLKVLRETLLRRSLVKLKRSVSFPSGSTSTDYIAPSNTIRQSVCSGSHFIQTLLHVVQVTISYALMLIFMSYNGYLAIAIIVGAGLGYFAFGWKKAVIVDINEHCH